MKATAALVTGAGRGIGAAVARELARRGHPVALTARTRSEIEAVAVAIAAAGGRACAVAADLSVAADVERLADVAIDSFGEIGILVNNAAVLPPLGPVWEIDPDLAAANTAAGLISAQRVLRAFLPPMVARGYGRVVAISSSSAAHPFAGLSAYCATKAGFEHLHRVAAVDLAGTGVLVNIVWPGGVATLMQEQLAERDGRGVPPMNTPDDVAPRIADLCGEEVTISGVLHDFDVT